MAAIVYYTGGQFNYRYNVPCLTKKYGESGTKMTPTRTTTGKMVQMAEIQRQSFFEINQDTCKNQAPSSKTQIENGKIEFFSPHLCLTKISIDSGQATSENLKQKKIKINFGVTSHPRRLVAKIPADIMAEKSIPRAPRIEMVVVSPDDCGNNKIFYHFPPSKNPNDAMAKVVFMRLIKI